MSKEFKVGDKVRALASSASGGFLEGYIYEVSNIYKNYSDERIEVVLDSLGGVNDWLSDNFELVEGFDDLIDIAVQAYRDGVIDNLEITKGVCSGAGVRINGNRQFTNSRPMEGIDFINSLYTETFVIESEEDYNSLKGGANIKLLNGEVIKRIVNYSPRTPEFSDANGRVVRLSYLTLKGATVTQKRS